MRAFGPAYLSRAITAPLAAFWNKVISHVRETIITKTKGGVRATRLLPDTQGNGEASSNTKFAFIQFPISQKCNFIQRGKISLDEGQTDSGYKRQVHLCPQYTGWAEVPGFG